MQSITSYVTTNTDHAVIARALSLSVCDYQLQSALARTYEAIKRRVSWCWAAHGQ